MIRALIIDDEPLACSMVAEYLAYHDDIETIGQYHNGFDGLKAIQEHEPDLVFLDIQMPKLNCFDMLDLLGQFPAVIFTTAFDEYALKAFDQHAVDYLLKPFSKDRFDHALEKYRERMPLTVPSQQTVETLSIQYPLADRVVIKNGAKIHILP